MKAQTKPVPPAPQTTPVPAAPISTELIDALTLEIERADVLAMHLEDRLFDLSDVVTGRELYALSLVAGTVCDKHEVILKQAQALFEAYQKTGGAK